MKEHLVNKNVSLQVAQELIDKIEKDLLGNKKSLKQQLKLEISKVLTPNISLNLLTEIKKKNSINEIYSICFVGVNGVGKSTNLSKICFWLLQNNLRVLIAACDTFRSGAVEQLKVHVRNLSALNTTKVELFSRGYGKDPAGIAKEAITFAKSEGFDVVLIDTAGRMQDNEPLMRALQKVCTSLYRLCRLMILIKLFLWARLWWVTKVSIRFKNLILR
jgi:signal recognition particle receptor subunit alpha